MRNALCTLAFANALWAPAAAQQALAVRQTDVKAKPFHDAQVVGSLAERSRVDVMKRQTSWLEIRAGANTGWVKMLSLRFEQPANAAAANAAANPFLASIAKGSGGGVATTGVRGLKEEHLTNPQPNPVALLQMQAYAGSVGDAAAFAAEAGLQAQSLNFVAEGAAK